MLRHQQSEFLRSFLFHLPGHATTVYYLFPEHAPLFYTQDLRAIDGFRTASWVEDYDVMYRLNAFHRDQQQRPCQVEIVPEAWATTDVSYYASYIYSSAPPMVWWIC